MAIAAGHARGEHLALLERRIVVGLLHVADLSVGMIGFAGQRRDGMGVGQPAAGDPILVEGGAARMAQAAGLDLLAKRRRRDAALRRPGPRVDRPGHTVPLVEVDKQSLAAIFRLAERPPAFPGLRPADMPGPLPMAGLAADADLGPGRGEAIRLRVIVLAQAGRVALGAHEIPVLVQPGPVQHVVVLDLLAGIEVKPALAALLLRPAVPRNRQSLHAAVGKRDEILLQGVETEGVFHLEHGELAVGAVGLDQKLSILAKKARPQPVRLEARAVEIAQHGLVGRMLHRPAVLRHVPQFRFRRVAARAGLAADKGRDPLRLARRLVVADDEIAESGCRNAHRHDRSDE